MAREFVVPIPSSARLSGFPDDTADNREYLGKSRVPFYPASSSMWLLYKHERM